MYCGGCGRELSGRPLRSCMPRSHTAHHSTPQHGPVRPLAMVSPVAFPCPPPGPRHVRHACGQRAGKERMERIAAASQGFLYLVSVTGVTGARSEVSARVQQLLEDIKAKTDLPVCVGFGVSTGVQAQQIKDWGADGVIVGSALVKCLGQASDPDDGVAAMQDLAQQLRVALD